MAMSAGSEDGEPMVEMNTTPLIDVMLVLLIMFIITIPIQTHAVKIDLPQNAPPSDSVIDPVKNKVAIDAGGVITWNGSPIDLLTLRQYLQQSLRLPVEPELQFQPDAQTRYVVVDSVLAEIKRAGVTKLGFVGNEQYGNF
ncbi:MULTISPECIES: ExbD/TolR family protein [Sphingomonadaceae]|jgi:biopolymer transport protein ExbD|uniref:Biopolymer transportern ExbD n=2 Tax=Sphingobium TaxID=165695 RepID=T0HFT6_9SPHN|nr:MULTISPECIES: biopolymer transporter ExbD [Sphingomonadaceae]MEE2740603.1 biopolymer transporter ExbD [Pseudomonadota bacterium]EQB11862.1 biopolymer transportern ExbD [Sphingobium lactosutens DS20]MAP44851.1 biopolymer transporter ExbD [Sphingobium sp.]MBA37084.1 biopolymer transporter ExbD [Sphingobium sp.]MBS48658.1 biopolymer transporter ExbD [Sphingobium sp.]|tara:strand:- start:287 stop:709 length:423 start_codon:yes stop_codon:yes gene_type:complete